ncbi:unnamed protein product [Nippostrongylus brasiliensis]|uniref:GILT-like protein F37H8.5 n=1 Tax=Nippostrongylus brasiliensis TaxID=27835 RepID=A0A0N4YDP6_NIPBR|nr:unnamed protein product [Nippostrongylus brasiliensis]
MLPHFLLPLLRSPGADKDLLTLDVFGESMCRDTTKFINNQLIPMYKKYHDYLYIRYHVFGPFFSTSCTKKGKHVTCSCQHGPEECSKNFLQACLIHSYPDDFDTLACIQGDTKFDEVFPNCLMQKYNETEIGRLHKCAVAGEGPLYMYVDGLAAVKLSGQITWVPWITIGNQRHASAEKDLETVLCQNFKSTPPECFKS